MRDVSSDNSTLDVADRELTKRVVASIGGLNAVETVRSLAVGVTRNAVDNLISDGGVELNVGDVKLVADDLRSEGEGCRVASREEILVVCADGDPVCSSNKVAAGELEVIKRLGGAEIDGIVLEGTNINVERIRDGLSGTATKVVKVLEESTLDVRGEDGETRSGSDVVLSDGETEDSNSSGKGDISGLSKGEINNVLLDVGGDGEGSRGKDGDIIIGREAVAAKVKEGV